MMGSERLSLNMKIKQTGTLLRQCLIAIALLLASIRQANSQSSTEWGAAMVGKDQLLIEFGAVAKGQEVELPIPIKNIYKEEVRIESLKAAGALSWDTDDFPIVISSGTERELKLRVDTLRHDGFKTHPANIEFYIPELESRALVQLKAKGYIRRDIVLMPGAAEFNSIEPAKAAEMRLSVRYAGREDWQILSATGANPHVDTEIIEKSRQDGRVDYEIVVRIKETAPLGRLSDRLILTTNDAKNPDLPEIKYSELDVRLAARIEPDIVALDVNFGSASPSQKKRHQVIVRNSRPTAISFKVEKLESTSHRILLENTDQPGIAKKFHILPLMISLPDAEGPFEDVVSITVDSQKDPVVFKVRGEIKALQTDGKEK